MVGVDRWGRATAERVGARLSGSWFWGLSLFLAGLVPLSALGHASIWVCAASSAALTACGAAALARRHGRRAGDVLLIAALTIVLLWSFWHVGQAAQVLYAVLVLTITGVGIRSRFPSP
jgi:hypothetical protein